MVSESVKQNSVVVQFASRVTSTFQSAATDSSIIGWMRDEPSPHDVSADPDQTTTTGSETETVEDTSTDPTGSTDESDDDEPWTWEADEPTDTTASVDPAGDTPVQTTTGTGGLFQASSTYQLFTRGTTVARSSRLYRWLTAEPEPEVIEIDLRTSRLIGPILTIIDEGVRMIASGTPRSRIAQAAYQARTRFVARPVRISSFGLLVVSAVLLAGISTSADPIRPATFGVLAVLILGARGTQSTMTWAELTDTGAYQALQQAFVPPEPPDERP